MGKKRTQGTISSFFRPRSSGKDTDASPKQPVSKKRRSSSGETPNSKGNVKLEAGASKPKNLQGDTVSAVNENNAMDEMDTSGENTGADTLETVIPGPEDTNDKSSLLKDKASFISRRKKRIVIEEEEEDEDEDDDDDDDDDDDGHGGGDGDDAGDSNKNDNGKDESNEFGKGNSESEPVSKKPAEENKAQDQVMKKTEDTKKPAEDIAEVRSGEDEDDSDVASDDEESGADSFIVENENDKKTKSTKKPTKKASKSKKQGTLAPVKPTESFKLSSAATWKPGKPVPYRYVADTFAKVEAITGRLAIQAILSDVFRVVIDTTPEDLVPVIYLAINKLAPSHEGVELGVGEGIVMKALSQVTGRTAQNLKAAYKEVGDIGDLAANSRATQKTMFPPPPLTVRKVFAEFKAIAKMSGKNIQDGKKAKIVKMLVAASKIEAKFITRALIGKLRIHLADKTVIASLASAMVLRTEKVDTGLLLTADGKKKTKLTGKEERIEESIKTASNILQSVYSQLPVWDKIVPEIMRMQKVDEELKAVCTLTPGTPVAPMLAKPTKSIEEVLDRFSETKFTCEYKYDGERAQVHRLEDGTVKIFSRNAENLTEKYPDLVSSLPVSLKEGFKGASFIIDGESTAYDIETKKILPFQMLQGRKRKDVNEESIKVKVCVFAFDLLYFNGTSLLQKSLQDRRKAMSEHFTEKEGVFMFAKGHDSEDAEEIQVLLDESIKAGCEGLMVKALEGQNGTYEPANRSQNWLKVKKDYLDGLGDTLDLVPIGGYVGRGKRAGQFGAFLLACYDPESEEYQSICKIGTGFTEEALENFDKFFKDPEENRILEKPKSYYRIPDAKNLQPDKWFEPCQVWEVLCADLSVSPQHMAGVGRVDANKGIALRFPRFKNVRDDKNVEDATSAEQVAELYMQQSAVANKS